MLQHTLEEEKNSSQSGFYEKKSFHLVFCEGINCFSFIVQQQNNGVFLLLDRPQLNPVFKQVDLLKKKLSDFIPSEFDPKNINYLTNLPIYSNRYSFWENKLIAPHNAYFFNKKPVEFQEDYDSFVDSILGGDFIFESENLRRKVLNKLRQDDCQKDEYVLGLLFLFKHTFQSVRKMKAYLASI